AAPLAGIAADRLARRITGGRVLVQAVGLLAGSVFVAVVGLCTTTPVLIASMTAFGFCKGCYDSGIFASLFDQVEPRARASAAGIMNTVGWGGGALGPVFVGWATNAAGKAGEVEAMSRAIAAGGIVYLICAGLLVAALIAGRRTAVATPT
ncbi:MAG: MFS transporter, partial [Planctomycetota bacterium]